MRHIKFRYSHSLGRRLYVGRSWKQTIKINRYAAIAVVAIVVAAFGLTYPFNKSFKPVDYTVPGQSYQICGAQAAQYLTSPWTYDALGSGSVSYTVHDYQLLPGYGTTLPPLPSYILGESPTTTAAMIFAPGSTVSMPAYDVPSTPIVYYFEGGAYNNLGLQTISGDQFWGGSAPGFPEPQFNDNNNAGGIEANNDSFSYSGGSATLASTANIGATSVTLTSPPTAYANAITFADGSTYTISNAVGNVVSLNSALTSSESIGSQEWTASTAPIATVKTAAAQAATTLSLNSSTSPMVQWGNYVVGTDNYLINSISGTQSGYTLTMSGGLDLPAAANTPVYYNLNAGDVSVEYLDISHDLHTTGGTLALGSGWTIEHNNIHDGYRNPGEGVAYYGGDEATIEYNCFSKMGDYGAGGGGTNEVFDYNEVYQAANEADPGCGCSGGGKWWGTMNADIVDNAFIEDGIGGDQGAVWFDNGNTGALVQGNYFYKIAGNAVDNETGFNMKVDNNLFLDVGWGDGTGQGTNNDGAVNINSSGGMNIPNSRFENQELVSNNFFINDWMGIDIWQSDQRSCLSSGEGYPLDSAYCSGGFPNTATTAAGGQYYFSHQGDSNHGGTSAVVQTASAGSSIVYVNDPKAINDQIGFADPASTTTANTTNVSSFSGSGTITVSSTAGFPTSGELRVDTSASGGGGGFTGAILAYTGTTGTSFTGVSLVRGTGTLTGPILQVQPYKVTSQLCFANDCELSISPSLTSQVNAGSTVTNAGTCPLFATSVALPSGPLAPNSVAYWDGCQWQSKNISVTGNTFLFQPSVIANSAPPIGSATTTVCDANNNQGCGTNFMAFQSGGNLPYNDQTGMNAMMSNSSFTGCPAWDPGCTTDPLKNINALANPPSAPANNGEAPDNNLWSNNTYLGPWNWNDVYSFSGCNPLPTDSVTGHTMPNSDCGSIGFPTWQSAWQQDTATSGSTSTLLPTVPGSVAANPVNATTIGVSWTASTDTGGPGLAGYQVFRNGTQVGTTASLSYNDTGLTPGVTYTYSVQAYDTSNNQSGSYATAQATTPTGCFVPLYRLRNPHNNDHLYTTNMSEVSSAVSAAGFTPEGIAGYVDPTTNTGETALYRLRQISNGYHFYTTNQSEETAAVSSGAFANEGIAGYVATATGTGEAAYLRLYNSHTGQHFYTDNQTEANSLTASGGYSSEGTIGYVYTAAQATCHSALYRLRSSKTGEHFYTTNTTEWVNAITSASFVPEGVAGYVDTSSQSGDTSLYRLRSLTTGQHFYTISSGEESALATSGSYAYEGVAGYVSSSSGTNLLTFLRLYNAHSGQHFYTDNQSEATSLTSSGGYAAEGNAGYVFMGQ